MVMIDIREARKDELSGLIPIYAEAFDKHGIFKRPAEQVLEYLENVTGDFIIAFDENDNRIIGGLLLVIRKPDTGHRLANIKHFAVAKEFIGEGIGKGLLREAERRVGEGKIEIHASTEENDAIGFYKHMGFVEEGRLSDHYRKGETCVILGKSVGGEEEGKDSTEVE
jgi:ribosomal protein S18 acetylase RimI-like enzyme